MTRLVVSLYLCPCHQRSILQEITDELSNTPKTVVSVTIPADTSTKQASTAAPTAAPTKSKSKDSAGVDKQPKGSEGTSKTKK